MTPFDVTYANEFLIQEAFASAPQHQVTQVSARPPQAAASSRGYPLCDIAPRGVALTPTAQPRSLETPSYAEFLLQVLDRDSVVTSLLFIAAYVGLVQSLS